ncbi:MAG: hypothetical protein GWM90_20120, partial [Gemmatimonadetes bacterium]|nr:hypothetical protein [Gemmatimonadota bacterium]NIQ56756.1 hypothetical protein [Gemmatimonadota bacterium]NIU76939.1 hypothetical protein [Gammaproteobacteria bacterium]NIX46306.1 hypothetical protein [Gemmatimonadota bacterium]NIY10633.1 hypothetical protein [Gemmatimonadota bacterium]
MAGEVERLLRQLRPSDVDPVPPTRSFSTSGAESEPVDDPIAEAEANPTHLGVWGRAILGVLLAVGLTRWPYLYCGVPLVFYLVGSALVVVTGVWAAYGSWRLRLGV